MTRESIKAIIWGVTLTIITALMIKIGSRNLEEFDAALVGYTFAVLFAIFGITYRYVMWLQRPPTRPYWRRGWSVFLAPRFVASASRTGAWTLTLVGLGRQLLRAAGGRAAIA